MFTEWSLIIYVSGVGENYAFKFLGMRWKSCSRWYWYRLAPRIPSLGDSAAALMLNLSWS